MHFVCDVTDFTLQTTQLNPRTTNLDHKATKFYPNKYVIFAKFHKTAYPMLHLFQGIKIHACKNAYA